MPKKQWLIDQLIGVEDIGMIYGPAGCGKTFVIIDMIVCSCSGLTWANRFSTPRPLNVAYCAGEGVSGLPSRFSAAAKHHNIMNLHNFHFFKTMPQLFAENNNANQTIGTINQFIIEWKHSQHMKEFPMLDLLVIDTLHTASLSADENSSHDMGKVLNSCRLAANELGCSVVLIHHTNKGGTSERGSSALRGAMDFMIEIKPAESEKNSIMSCSKLKDGEAWNNQKFNLISEEEYNSVYVSWGELLDKIPKKTKTEDKSKIIAEMERHPGKSFTSKLLSEVINQTPSYTIKLLNELINENKCDRELSNQANAASSRNPWIFKLK